MTASVAEQNAAACFDGLPHAPARALLAWVCTSPEGPVPGEMVRAAVPDESAGLWLLDAAHRGSLSGLLWCRLTPQQKNSLPASTRRALSDAHLAFTLRGEALQRLLERYVSRLKDAGIPVLLLKGAALAQTVYSDPAERVMRDLDLLVPDDKLERARALLADDATSALPDRPGLRHLGAVLLPGEYTSIELHSADHHTEWWPQAERGDPFERAEPIAIGTATAYRLNLADSFLHVACHGVRHAFPDWLTMAADVNRLLSQPDWGTAGWEEICRAARAKGRQRAVALAVAFAFLGHLPTGLREVLPSALADDSESSARIAWRIAFDQRQLTVHCWHRAWGRDRGWPRLREIREYVFPPLWKVARRFRTSPAVAAAVYPWYTLARAGNGALIGWRWRSLLRRYA